MHRLARAGIFAPFFASLAFAAIPATQPVAPPFQTGDVQLVTPHGLHVITVTLQGSRHVVMIDNEPGPQFDDILPAAAEIEDHFDANGAVLTRNVKPFPVAVSADGTHTAYAARLDRDVVVIVDGKEIFRAPFTPVAPVVQLLRFSPDGKHTMFLTSTTDTMNSVALVMDGQKQPATLNGAFPVFSRDGSHYAYVATKPKGDGTFLVVDGSVADYLGDRPRWTASNKLITLRHASPDSPNDIVQLDGKPLLQAQTIKSFVVSPTEDKVAIIAGNDGGKTTQLYFNGDLVPGTDGANQFFFSPDGKRWALMCVASPSWWMILDGQKSATYSGLTPPLFTDDSSKTIYVADSGNKHFVVVNNQEELGGIYVRVQPKVAGNHYAYVIGDNLSAMRVVYDGKATPPGADVMDIALSADGSRFGYFGKGGITDYSVHIDGGELTGASGGDYRKIFFSPNNKHYATIASPPKGYPTLLIDDAFVPIINRQQPGEPMFFTDDGEHLFVRRNETSAQSNAGAIGVYMDGKKVAEFDGYSRNWPRNVMWENNADGTVSLLGGQPAGNAPGPAVKITIDPKSAGTTVASIVDNANAEQAALDKAAADALAAKKQAEADAKAARDKAAADAKAARDKARADAAAAKAKAKADAAAAKAAKKAQS